MLYCFSIPGGKLDIFLCVNVIQNYDIREQYCALVAECYVSNSNKRYYGLTGRECICGRILQLNVAGVCCEFREMVLLEEGGKVLTTTWSGDMIKYAIVRLEVGGHVFVTKLEGCAQPTTYPTERIALCT